VRESVLSDFVMGAAEQQLPCTSISLTDPRASRGLSLHHGCRPSHGFAPLVKHLSEPRRRRRSRILARRRGDAENASVQSASLPVASPWRPTWWRQADSAPRRLCARSPPAIRREHRAFLPKYPQARWYGRQEASWRAPRRRDRSVFAESRHPVDQNVTRSGKMCRSPWEIECYATKGVPAAKNGCPIPKSCSALATRLIPMPVSFAIDAA